MDADSDSECSLYNQLHFSIISNKFMNLIGLRIATHSAHLYFPPETHYSFRRLLLKSSPVAYFSFFVRKEIDRILAKIYRFICLINFLS
jgi:hypothetical protein